MKYFRESGDGTFVFSTGKQIKAPVGAIGISPDYLWGTVNPQWFSASHGMEGFLPPLNKEETAELADYMIELWTDVKNRGLYSEMPERKIDRRSR